jgi:hypothetical protein
VISLSEPHASIRTSSGSALVMSPFAPMNGRCIVRLLNAKASHNAKDFLNARSARSSRIQRGYRYLGSQKPVRRHVLYYGTRKACKMMTIV